jgi:hypothetical protein
VRPPVRLLAAAVTIGGSLALVQARGGDETAVVNADGWQRQSTLPASSPHACRILTRRIATAFLDGPASKYRDDRRATGDVCTYLSRDRARSVTVGLYPASDYDSVAAGLPRTRRTSVAGRKAVFNSRLGHFVELPNRPYYVQATFQHVTHLHADRPMSKRLATTLLSDAPVPQGRYICALTGKRLL